MNAVIVFEALSMLLDTNSAWRTKRRSASSVAIAVSTLVFNESDEDRSQVVRFFIVALQTQRPLLVAGRRVLVGLVW